MWYQQNVQCVLRQYNETYITLVWHCNRTCRTMLRHYKRTLEQDTLYVLFWHYNSTGSTIKITYVYITVNKTRLLHSTSSYTCNTCTILWNNSREFIAWGHNFFFGYGNETKWYKYDTCTVLLTIVLVIRCNGRTVVHVI